MPLFFVYNKLITFAANKKINHIKNKIMATAYHNLSDYDPSKMPDASDMSVGIVVAEWNENITTPLLNGAIETLTKNGVKEENIYVAYVPGTFELTFGDRKSVV